MTDCKHPDVTTWGSNDTSLWACRDCQRRFYPACPTCVDVGHRGIEHPVLPIGEPAMHAHDGLGTHRAETHHRPQDCE